MWMWKGWGSIRMLPSLPSLLVTCQSSVEPSAIVAPAQEPLYWLLLIQKLLGWAPLLPSIVKSSFRGLLASGGAGRSARYDGVAGQQ